MCIAPNGESYITTPDDPRPRRDGKQVAPIPTTVGGGKPAPIRASDVSLGDGLADTAKQALLTRREKMRIALEGS